MDIITLAAAKSYTDKKTANGGGGAAADDENIMDTMAEIGLIDPVTLSDGSIITSNKNEIYTF